MKAQVSVYVTMQNVASAAKLLAMQEDVEMTLSNVVEFALEMVAMVAEGKGIEREPDHEVAEVLDRFNILPTQMSMKLNKKLPRKVEALKLAARSGVGYASAIAGIEIANKEEKWKAKAPPKLDLRTIPVIADEPTAQEHKEPEPPPQLTVMHQKYMEFANVYDHTGKKPLAEVMRSFKQQESPSQELWAEYLTWTKQAFPKFVSVLEGVE